MMKNLEVYLEFNDQQLYAKRNVSISKVNMTVTSNFQLLTI